VLWSAWTHFQRRAPSSSLPRYSIISDREMRETLCHEVH